jgi:hypothetical protein
MYICPTNLPPVSEQKLRVLKPADLVFMNNWLIESFYHMSIDVYKPTDVIDYTELLVSRKENCNYRYLCLRNDLATVTGDRLCSREEECEIKFKGELCLISDFLHAINFLGFEIGFLRLKIAYL